MNKEDLAWQIRKLSGKPLTERESQVRVVIRESPSLAEAARRLNISRTMIHVYQEKLLKKLGLAGSWQLILVLAFTGCLFAQPVITLSTTDAVFPGTTITVHAALTGGGNIAAVGTSLPNGAAVPVAGAAAVAASKTLYTDVAVVNVLLIGETNPQPPAKGAPSALAIGDGELLSFAYRIAPNAPLNSTVSVALGTTRAADVPGAVAAVTVSPLSLSVGFSPTCLGAIVTHIASYLSAPTDALLGQIEAELQSASTTGNCQ